MKQKWLLVCLCVLLACGSFGCGSTVNHGAPVVHRGAIGDFSLLAPGADAVVYEPPVFSWQAAENADCYTLEVCSSTRFSQTEDAVYIKKTGIVSTTYAIGADLADKNTDYFWRVTAVNADTQKASSQGVARFYLSAAAVTSIDFDIDYADEWTVHREGSVASVSVDKTDFFGNGKNALKVAFCEEDTNRGEPTSDGWMVITHQAEREMYGVDAFYFNFYYSGDDADVYLRVVDDDNEYWHAQVKLANNAKQQIIIGFDEFELRTKGGTTIANQVFDYHHIKYVELVFEKAFGDGVALLSDLRAVRSADFAHLFISQMDFAAADPSQILRDNYNFGVDISQDGHALTYSYGADINGYGFVKLPVGKLLTTGDAFAVTLSRTGTANGANILFRLIEEDGDRWVYKHKVSSVENGETILIPFSAFTLSEYNGDGARQFYYIKQFQFGLEGNYQSGSITFADLRVVTLEDEMEDLFWGHLADDGTIDDFEGYGSSVELYYTWQNSTENKDELMALDKEFAFGSGNTCLKLGYKSDMFAARYGIMFEGREGFDALQIWAKDNSTKNSEAVFNHIDEVCATMIVTLYLDTGEQYSATIGALNKYWTNYVICFDDFRLDGEIYGTVQPLVSEHIAGVSVALQYYYYEQNGTPHPMYMNNNAVYIDNLAFVTAEESRITELAHKIVPTEDDPKLAVIDDYEGGVLLWNENSAYGYEGLALVPSYDGGTCLEMQYRGSSDSVSYATTLLVDDAVNARAVQVKIKGDGKATVYINIYLEYAGNVYKYRAALVGVSEEWTVYTIGFDNFNKIEGSGNTALAKSLVPYINKITFGIVNWQDHDASSILVDDLCFDGNAGYTANSAEPVEE